MARHKSSPPAIRRRGVGMLRWAVRVASSIVLWTALLHLSSLLGLPRPPLLAARPSCLGGGGGGGSNSSASSAVTVAAADEVGRLAPPAVPRRSEWFLSC
uniref:Uncharacterized protein n=1 Tax=Oryza glaberrima TaxID=4538 RepID=I1QRY1_ORYGL